MSAPNIIDPRSECILHHDIESLSHEFEHGKQVGESWGIKELDRIYTRMPGFLYAHTGWPNSGKSTINLFIKLVNAIKFGRKYQVWSFEETSYRIVNGKPVENANNLFDNLVHMYTGKNPYKHWEKQHSKKQIAYDEWLAAHEFISNHFVFPNIKDKHYKNLTDHVRWVYDEYGTAGFVFDPWLKVKLDDIRDDRALDYALEEIKLLCLQTNQTGDIIVHPRTDKAPKNGDGSYKKVDHFGLNGGAAWNNNIDCLMSWYRPFAHKLFTDPNYSLLTAINYKQRDEQLTNRKGEYENIEFDFYKNRYYFDGVCPIDGELKKGFQPEIKFSEPWHQAKTDEVPF